MAMYEGEGFCPQDSFLRYQKENKSNVSPLWERAQELLGDRIGYMVYTMGGCTEIDRCSVVDAIVGGSDGSLLGIGIASILNALIPECIYSKTLIKILITDLPTSFHIPNGIFRVEDNRYIVGIAVESKSIIHLYFVKKYKEKKGYRSLNA